MKVENAIKVIQQEIIWCEKNPHEDASFKKGFIEGLKQAELLLTKTLRNLSEK